MPIDRPSLPTLQAQTQADIESRVNGAAPKLRRSLIGSIGAALSGGLNALYGYVDKIAKQCNPATATGKYLELWCSLWGVVRKLPSVAFGDITITGAVGTSILAGTQLQSTLGIVYATNADAVIGSGGSVTVTVTATTAGADGNQPEGAVLTFVTTTFGVDSTATAVDGIGAGADTELDDSLRARLFQRVQHPPHGGNDADYVGWATSVASITRAWTFPLYSGLGTVRVYVANDNYSGTTLASAADVTAAQTYIDSVKPVGCAQIVSTVVVSGVEVVAPTKDAIAISLSISPDTPDNRAAVQKNLQDAFFLRAKPEATFKLHWIQKAIADAGTVDDYNMTTPTADTTAAAGQICTLGTITWL
jgi:uncharacterized phage protein gp47/JayE